MTFRDEPDRKHLFSGRSEDYIHQWVTAMKQATYVNLTCGIPDIKHASFSGSLLYCVPLHFQIRTLEISTSYFTNQNQCQNWKGKSFFYFNPSSYSDPNSCNINMEVGHTGVDLLCFRNHLGNVTYLNYNSSLTMKW
jgi:hypothetical protein